MHKHGAADSHKKMVNSTLASKPINKVFQGRSDLDSSTSEDIKAKTFLIRLVACMVEHNYSFFGCRTSCRDCWWHFFEGRNMLKMKRTKASKINQNVLTKAQRENLVGDLKVNKFSVLIDESADISTS